MTTAVFTYASYTSQPAVSITAHGKSQCNSGNGQMCQHLWITDTAKDGTLSPAGYENRAKILLWLHVDEKMDGRRQKGGLASPPFFDE